MLSIRLSIRQSSPRSPRSQQDRDEHNNAGAAGRAAPGDVAAGGGQKAQDATLLAAEGSLPLDELRDACLNSQFNLYDYLIDENKAISSDLVLTRSQFDNLRIFYQERILQLRNYYIDIISGLEHYIEKTKSSQSYFYVSSGNSKTDIYPQDIRFNDHLNDYRNSIIVPILYERITSELRISSTAVKLFDTVQATAVKNSFEFIKDGNNFVQSSIYDNLEFNLYDHLIDENKAVSSDLVLTRSYLDNLRILYQERILQLRNYYIDIISGLEHYIEKTKSSQSYFYVSSGVNHINSKTDINPQDIRFNDHLNDYRNSIIVPILYERITSELRISSTAVKLFDTVQATAVKNSFEFIKDGNNFVQSSIYDNLEFNLYDHLIDENKAVSSDLVLTRSYLDNLRILYQERILQLRNYYIDIISGLEHYIEKTKSSQSYFYVSSITSNFDFEVDKYIKNLIVTSSQVFYESVLYSSIKNDNKTIVKNENFDDSWKKEAIASQEEIKLLMYEKKAIKSDLKLSNNIINRMRVDYEIKSHSMIMYYYEILSNLENNLDKKYKESESWKNESILFETELRLLIDEKSKNDKNTKIQIENYIIKIKELHIQYEEIEIKNKEYREIEIKLSNEITELKKSRDNWQIEANGMYEEVRLLIKEKKQLEFKITEINIQNLTEKERKQEEMEEMIKKYENDIKLYQIKIEDEKNEKDKWKKECIGFNEEVKMLIKEKNQLKENYEISK